MDRQIDYVDETAVQGARWQRSATLLALAFACTAEYWTTASVSLTLTDLGGSLGASSDEASWALTIALALNGMFIALSIPTLGVAVFALVVEEETSSARAIFYGMRQFGASVGVTLSVALIERRTSLHSSRLLEGLFDRGLLPFSQSSSLSIESLKGLEVLVRKQSLVLAFADNFNVMASWQVCRCLPSPYYRHEINS